MTSLFQIAHELFLKLFFIFIFDSVTMAILPSLAHRGLSWGTFFGPHGVQGEAGSAGRGGQPAAPPDTVTHPLTPRLDRRASHSRKPSGTGHSRCSAPCPWLSPSFTQCTHALSHSQSLQHHGERNTQRPVLVRRLHPPESTGSKHAETRRFR